MIAAAYALATSPLGLFVIAFVLVASIVTDRVETRGDNQ